MIYAHSANANGDWHALSEHLTCVSQLATKFAGNATWRDEAALAGLLHDLGKYADRFQARLHGHDSGLDHWSQGAWLALVEHKAIAAALAIQGHHVGLQRATSDSLRRLEPKVLIQNHPFHLDLSDPDPVRLKQLANHDGLDFHSPLRTALSLRSGMEKAIAAMLDVRLLFSCLVDADFLDTEAHFNGDASGKKPRAQGLDLDDFSAIEALDAYMQETVRTGSQADVRVRQARESLWQAATQSAQAAPGVFTLTAPTGSGKTLAMLKFALEHAAKHHLHRIVIVVPFLSIIEQTARIYRAVFKDFSEEFVLEHHSLAGLGKEGSQNDSEADSDRQRRLLSQNWDAPIVLTTNVQLLESLFSNRPSACRKLHNLMDSMILFDEAQSLPQHLAVPTLAALSHLSATYGSTIVFATATQPAFDALHDEVRKYAADGWQPAEAAPGHPELFDALKRVEVLWPQPGETLGWPELADRLRNEKQVLCVVNLKRHSLDLLDALDDAEGVFHLSTNLCTEHRRMVLEEVRARLNHGKTCRLIATQCIEAGVDVDFPLVYRAVAPLEAIAQAAGRCNREGRMSEYGKVIVFQPDTEDGWRKRYPTHVYFQAAEVMLTMLAEHGDLDINNPVIFRDYYRRLYDVNNPASQNQELLQAIQALDFVEIARLYRLIDQDAIQVLVPWQDRLDEFAELRAEADRIGISPDWMRRAQGLAVGIYRPKAGHPAWSVLIPAKLKQLGKPQQGRQAVSDEWFIIEDPRGEYYHETQGLKLPQSDPIFIA